jgi:hypothetical protein
VTKTKEPTIQTDGRLHYKLPDALSAHIQAADLHSHEIQFPLVPKYQSAPRL